MSTAARRSSSTNTARRAPRQQRSRATVDTILEGAAQVFRELGYERATTNQIAAVAGVSVGSLYQYFPDKSAIAQALTHQVESAWADRFLGAAARVVDASVEDAVKELVGVLLDCYEADPRLVHVLLSIPRESGAPFMPAPPPLVMDALHTLLEARQHLVPGVDLDVAPTLLARAVDAAAYASFVEGKLPRRRLEPQLVRMCLGYLLGPRE